MIRDKIDAAEVALSGILNCRGHDLPQGMNVLSIARLANEVIVASKKLDAARRILDPLVYK